MSKELTEQQFLLEVKDHVMEVLRDDGAAGRHIRFRKPGTMTCHFDLITWPGYLCYTGDMGTYVFRRLHDMFEFFGTDDAMRRQYPDRTLFPNFSYWAEKLEALDCNGRFTNGVTEFDPECFHKAVDERVAEFTEDWPSAERSALEEDVRDDILSKLHDYDGDASYHIAGAAVQEFASYNQKGERVAKDLFDDFISERNFTKFTHRFRWCCYALSWGVMKYDETKTTLERERNR